MNKKPKLLVILGPTAVGKSAIAVQIAQWVTKEKIGGYIGAEIISADSRQVYKGLDIGTGKITQAEMHGIPHHLLDVADPHQRFTAIDWKQQAEQVIREISARGNIPIICGGTGFYISTLIDNLGFPDVDADTEEQKKLEALSVDELFAELKRLDPARSKTIEPKNKRRLARAIIIARALGAVPPISQATESPYNATLIGLTLPGKELKERVRTRLIQRLDAGMIEEVRQLLQQAPSSQTASGSGLSYERMDELGLEYRYINYFLASDQIHTKDELIEQLSAKIWRYAKRQMTWFKRDQRIHWFTPTDLEKIRKIINDSL